MCGLLLGQYKMFRYLFQGGLFTCQPTGFITVLNIFLKGFLKFRKPPIQGGNQPFQFRPLSSVRLRNQGSQYFALNECCGYRWALALP